MLNIFKKLFPRNSRQAPVGQRQQTTYVVAYPKSGQTWLRVMLGRYAQLVCDLPSMPLFDGGEHSLPEFAGYRGPTIEFTHAPLAWETQTANDLTDETVFRPFNATPAILLLRYPLDVLVSAYMQQKYQIKGRDKFTGDLSDYVEDPVFGLDKLVKFHEIWANHLDHSNQVFLIRYEDLVLRTKEVFTTLLDYLGFDDEEALVEDAVEFASFSNMKEMQSRPEQLRYPTSGLPIFGPIDLSSENTHHVRKGRPGGYRDEISEDLALRLEQEDAARMPTIYGYNYPPRSQAR